LEDQPLRHEAVERRQRRDRDAADENDEACERHAVNEAAELVHVALARSGQYGAGAEEQQALEEGVVERVKQRGGEGERRRRFQSIGLERHGKAEAAAADGDTLY